MDDTHFLVFTTGEMWFWITWAVVTVIGAAALGYLTGERIGRRAERRWQATRDAEDWPRPSTNDAVSNIEDVGKTPRGGSAQVSGWRRGLKAG